MPRAQDLASYLIDVSTPSTPWSLTPLKLQKLLYYCQGWHLALTKGQVLFEDDIMAWEHGPVVKDIYHEFKHLSYFTIPKPKKRFDNKTKKGKKIFTNKQIEIINAVWEAYGEFDGKYLEELTHQEEPWLDTPINSVIKKDKIANYFTKLASGS